MHLVKESSLSLTSRSPQEAYGYAISRFLVVSIHSIAWLPIVDNHSPLIVSEIGKCVYSEGCMHACVYRDLDKGSW